jgi:hypothetical protein
MKWISGLALTVGLISTAPASSVARTCPVATFCGGWHSLCLRRLPANEAGECAKRRTACLSSRCFYFKSPRPRCMSNAEDMALTTACQRARKAG